MSLSLRLGPQLRSLKLTNCRLITDEGLLFVAKYCLNLRCLFLDRSAEYRDGMILFLFICPFFSFSFILLIFCAHRKR